MRHLGRHTPPALGFCVKSIPEWDSEPEMPESEAETLSNPLLQPVPYVWQVAVLTKGEINPRYTQLSAILQRH